MPATLPEPTRVDWTPSVRDDLDKTAPGAETSALVTDDPAHEFVSLEVHAAASLDGLPDVATFVYVLVTTTHVSPGVIAGRAAGVVTLDDATAASGARTLGDTVAGVSSSWLTPQPDVEAVDALTTEPDSAVALIEALRRSTADAGVPCDDVDDGLLTWMSERAGVYAYVPAGEPEEWCWWEWRREGDDVIGGKKHALSLRTVRSVTEAVRRVV